MLLNVTEVRLLDISTLFVWFWMENFIWVLATLHVSVCLIRVTGEGGGYLWLQTRNGLRIKITSFDFLSTLNSVNGITAACPKTICPAGIVAAHHSTTALHVLVVHLRRGMGVVRSPFFAVWECGGADPSVCRQVLGINDKCER